MKGHPIAENFTLTAKIKDADYVQAVDVFVISKRLSVFIQTDKPMYKPEDVVQFRLLVLDADTKPYQLNKLKYNITDSNGNAVFESSTLRNPFPGVFIDDYKISDSPPLGKWSIHVKVDNGEETVRSFDVAEYVLPRFGAHIVCDSNVLLNDRKFKVTVYGEYTFGEFVHANAVISAKVYDRKNFELLKIEKVKTATVSAKKAIEFDMIRDLKISSSSIIKVQVVLTEILTGKKANDSMTIVVHEKAEHKIQLIRSDIQLKPGFPFAIKAVVRRYDGSVEEDQKKDIKFKVTYFYSQPKRAKHLSNKNSRLLNSTLHTSIPIRNGLADFEIEVYKNVTGLAVTANYSDSEASLNVTRFPSKCREYLKAQILNERFERTFNFGQFSFSFFSDPRLMTY